MNAREPIYRRIILKLTGEIFKSNGDRLSEDAAVIAAREIKSIYNLGVQVAIVLGGGNLFRGRDFQNSKHIKKDTADYISMLATIQNGLAFKDILRDYEMQTRLMSALETKQVAEPHIHERAVRHLEKGRVVVLVGGIGTPNFTTDATAVNRAIDLGAQAILKGTKVEGVYNKDPMKYSDAEFWPEPTAREMILKEIEVVEPTALTLNRGSKIPFYVFNIFKEGNLKKLLLGEKVGSRIIF